MTDAAKPLRKRKAKGPFSDELIDQLLSQAQGKDARSLLGESGVVGQLKKQLAERMLSAELTHHLGNEAAAAGDGTGGPGNHRNGTTPKTVLTPEGALPLDIPRDRLSTFEPLLVAKYQRRLPGFDDRVIGLYARGMTVREIQGHLLEIYGLEVAPQLVSSITDEVLAEVAQWQARALEAQGVDLIQFDEPAFNVYMQDAADWGVAALERAAQGLTCTTAVHICYGYGIKANLDWKETLGKEWRQYERVFPALARSRIGQVSLECFHSHVPVELTALLEGKDVMIGVIDVASDEVETPEQVAQTIGKALQHVPKNRLIACTNCGMAPMRRDIALRKLDALAQGAALARQRYA